MAADRTEFGVARTVCACSDCVANCRFVPGALIPADLNRISEYLIQTFILWTNSVIYSREIIRLCEASRHFLPNGVAMV